MHLFSNSFKIVFFVIMIFSSSHLYAFRGRCKTEDAFFKTFEGGCKNQETGLVWTLSSEEGKTFNEAKEYCKTFYDESFKDWRLPTVEELLKASRLNLNRYFNFDVNELFWADDNSNASSAFMVSLSKSAEGSSEVFNIQKAKPGKFVCVRQGETDGCKKEGPVFVTAHGGCLDKSRGIVWSRQADKMMTWQNAMDYCAAYRAGSYSDWRLPEYFELGKISGEHAQEYFMIRYQEVWSGDWTNDLDLLIDNIRTAIVADLRKSYIEDTSIWGMRWNKITDNLGVFCVRKASSKNGGAQ